MHLLVTTFIDKTTPVHEIQVQFLCCSQVKLGNVLSFHLVRLLAVHRSQSTNVTSMLIVRMAKLQCVV